MDSIMRTPEAVRDAAIVNRYLRIADALINPPHPHRPGQELHLGRDQAGNDCYYQQSHPRDCHEWAWFRRCTVFETTIIRFVIKAKKRRFEAYAGPAHGALHVWAPHD